MSRQAIYTERFTNLNFEPADPEDDLGIVELTDRFIADFRAAEAAWEEVQSRLHLIVKKAEK